MSAKELKFSVDARDSMLRGIDILAHAVRVTLGPREQGYPIRAMECVPADEGYKHMCAYISGPVDLMQAIATENGTVAIAKIDLNRRYDDDWLGNMRERFNKELRLDVPMRRAGYAH